MTASRPGRLPTLNRSLLRTAVLMGLAVGLLLCPTFGERWRQTQVVRADEGAKARPLSEVLSRPLARAAAREAMGPPTPAYLSSPLDVDTPDGRPRVQPGALDLAEATEVDGALVQVLGDGLRVVFSVDPELQRSLRELLEHYAPPMASVVVMEARTGRILAMVDHTTIESLKGMPLALRTEAPAASIFKIVSAAALLESGKVSTGTPVCYSGGRNGIQPRHLQYDPERDHTCKNLGEGLAGSINPVFAQLTHRFIDQRTFQRVADRFGFNRPLPFLWPALAGEVTIPDSDLERGRCAAGFGHSTLSPLHGALIASALGNRGAMMAPVIVDRIEEEGRPVFTWSPAVLSRVTTPEVATTLTRLLAATTTEGTAARYFHRASPALRDIAVSGKTGSLSGPMAGSTYHFSWFVGVAPADDPRVAVAAVVANEPRWKVKSTLVAREALESYFSSEASPAGRVASGSPEAPPR